jgi:hypothetical protein
MNVTERLQTARTVLSNLNRIAGQAKAALPGGADRSFFVVLPQSIGRR